jgi:protein tyrosine phosphatase (PTP) superfamily phosphohydrolase (DUF442 family)/cytochrome c556
MPIARVFRFCFLALALAASLALFPSMAYGQENDPEKTSSQIRKLDSKLLPNLIQVNDKVYSGGQPSGREAFGELKELGIRTIISVDGAKPDVQSAESLGLRYVHLPHGYDSVPQQRAKELAKAVDSLEGPFYIHCHHGQHRSPVAAAVIGKLLGTLSAADAADLLRLAGTDTRYRGLFKSVEEAEKLSSKELDTVPTNFPKQADVPPLTQKMVEIEELFDHLKSLQIKQWQTSDRAATQQNAILLYEQFRELSRAGHGHPRVSKDKFTDMCKLSEQAPLTIEKHFQASEGIRTVPHADLDKAMRVLQDNCKACHQLVRN